MWIWSFTDNFSRCHCIFHSITRMKFQVKQQIKFLNTFQIQNQIKLTFIDLHNSDVVFVYRFLLIDNFVAWFYYGEEIALRLLYDIARKRSGWCKMWVDKQRIRDEQIWNLIHWACWNFQSHQFSPKRN